MLIGELIERPAQSEEWGHGDATEPLEAPTTVIQATARSGNGNTEGVSRFPQNRVRGEV